MRYNFRRMLVILLLIMVIMLTGCEREVVDIYPDGDSSDVYDEPVRTIDDLIAERNARVRLTLGVLHADLLLGGAHIAIEDFNIHSTTHYVYIIDYSSLVPGDNFTDALRMLNMDIISGRAPDMLVLDRLPFEHYIERGLLVDLYSFLDFDPELGRESLVEDVLLSMESNGRLYRIAPFFLIDTIAGSREVLGDYPGWDLSEFMSGLENNPQADLPMGPFTTSGGFVWWLLGNIDEFIDRKSGEIFFDRGDFALLLDFAENYISDDYFHFDFAQQRELIASSRQIMEPLTLHNFIDLWVVSAMFDNDVVFKGWPRSDRSGSNFVLRPSFAITTNASDKDGAWEFLRTLLMDRAQRLHFDLQFPVSRSLFEDRLNNAMRRPLRDQWERRELPSDAKLTEEDVERFMQLMSSISRTHDGVSDELRGIVSEVVWDFLNGRNTSEEAARIAQNRVFIYVSE